MIYGNDPERPGEKMPHREQLDKIKIRLHKPLPKWEEKEPHEGPSLGLGTVNLMVGEL